MSGPTPGLLSYRKNIIRNKISAVINEIKSMKMRGMALIPLILFSASALYAQNDAEGYHKAGSKALDAQDYQACIEYNTQAIALKADYSGAYWDRAVCYDKAEQYQKAIADYNKAIALDSSTEDLAILFTNRGLVYFHLIQYDSAIADYNTAIKKNPERADAYWNRGLVYSRKNEDQKAINDYTTALKYCTNGHDRAILYDNRAVEYNDLDKYAEALKDLNDALDHDSKIGSAYWHRATAYAGMELYNKAWDDYTTAIRYYKTKPEELAKIYCQRSIAARNIKLYYSAISDCGKAIDLKPDYGIAYWDRAMAYNDLDDYQNALNNYSIALIFSTQYSFDDLAKLYSNRAIVNYHLENYSDAIADDTRALELVPDKKLAYWYRALSLDESEKNEEALDDFNKAIELYADNKEDLSVLYGHRALVKCRMTKYDDGIQDYNKALELNPNNRSAYWNKGVAYDCKEEYKTAIELYTNAMGYYKGDNRNLAILYCNRGFCNEMLKKYDDAVADYSESISLNKNYFKAYKFRGRMYLNTLNDKEKAEKDFKKLLKIYKGYGYYSVYAKFFTGNTLGAQADIARLVSYADNVSPEPKNKYFDIACLYALMNDDTNAVKYLELSFRHGYNNYENLFTSIELDKLKGSDAFKNILKKYGVN
jgi:tetratricopeptide (TPR) repeat protein